MILKFAVDAAAAFLAGKDPGPPDWNFAGVNTHKLDVDPAELSEHKRFLIAARMRQDGAIESVFRRCDGMPALLVVAEKSVAGIVLAIEQELVLLARKKEKDEAEEAAKAEAVRQKTIAVYAERRTKTKTLYAWHTSRGPSIREHAPSTLLKEVDAIAFQAFDTLSPDWPWPCAEIITEQPAAKEWAAELQAANNAAQEAAAAKAAEVYAAMVKSIEDEKAEREAAKAAMAKQIAQWVDWYGDPSQHERLQAELLPEQEIIDAMERQAFMPLEKCHVYRRFRVDDVCECLEPAELECCSIEHSAEDAAGLTREEFDSLQALKKLLPGAGIQPITNLYETSQCLQSTSNASAIISLRVGCFLFEREYPLSGNFYTSRQDLAESTGDGFE